MIEPWSWASAAVGFLFGVAVMTPFGPVGFVEWRDAFDLADHLDEA